MGRKSKSKSLNVWTNGALVGLWVIEPSGLYTFKYYKNWLWEDGTFPISISMPLQMSAFKGDVVVNFFDNLLPDNEKIRNQIQNRFGLQSKSPFELLAEIGRDCVGSIQLLPVDEKPSKEKVITSKPIDDKDIESMLINVKSFGRNFSNDEDFRISLAGAQEKTALLFNQGEWFIPTGSTPTTHILKLPIGQKDDEIDLTGSVENEWLCEQILSAYGVPVARSEIKYFGSKKTLVVERFDREFVNNGEWIKRIPQEDFCQATGTPPGLKYESDGGPGMEAIVEILRGSSQAKDDVMDFFRRQVIFWMLCAIDGHAKNFSIFIEQNGSYRLTPSYDVISAHPVLGVGKGKLDEHKVKMAMAFKSKNNHYIWKNIIRRHLVQAGLKMGLVDSDDLVQEIAKSAELVIKKVSALLPDDFDQHVSSSIFNGLLSSSMKLIK